MAQDGFKVIDTEPHLTEPYETWEALPEPYRSWTEIDGRRGVRLAGTPLLNPGNNRVERLAARRLAVDPQLKRVREEKSPELFVEGMDVEGIDVGVVMPSPFALGLIREDNIDPDYALALTRAYNDYAHEFTSSNRDRLRFWGLVPLQDGRLAAQEARRCVERLGAVGVATTKPAMDGHLFSDRFFQPLWEALNQMRVPFGLHGPGGGGMRDNVKWRYRRHRRTGVVASALGDTFHAMSAIGEMIISGVFEDYPELRLVIMESGTGWIPWLLWRLDERWDNYGPDEDYMLSLTPTEYFRRNCYAVVEPDEEAVQYTIDAIGDDNLVFSTDFPHQDSLFPNAVKTFLSHKSVSDESKRKILWDNGALLYGIGSPPVPHPSLARAAGRRPPSPTGSGARLAPSPSGRGLG